MSKDEKQQEFTKLQCPNCKSYETFIPELAQQLIIDGVLPAGSLSFATTIEGMVPPKQFMDLAPMGTKGY